MQWQAKYSRPLQLPNSWQQLPQGEQYCTALTDYFSAWTTKILGYQILKIGGLSAEIEFDLPLRHQMILLPEPPNFSVPKAISCIQSDIYHLPFVEKSIDACLLANTLNFSQDPHQLLREVARVSADNGYLFLSFFNPFSPLILKGIKRKSRSEFAFRHYLPCRVKDWLELLNYQIIEEQHIKLSSTCFAPLIAIVAQKRTYPLTLNPQKVRFNQQTFLQPINAFAEIINKRT